MVDAPSYGKTKKKRKTKILEKKKQCSLLEVLLIKYLLSTSYQGTIHIHHFESLENAPIESLWLTMTELSPYVVTAK